MADATMPTNQTPTGSLPDINDCSVAPSGTKHSKTSNSKGSDANDHTVTEAFEIPPGSLPDFF